MKQYLWKDQAVCLGMDTDLFFDKYEDNVNKVSEKVDKLCKQCPVRKICFANGVSNKEWGVWGGVYLENGEISREFNKHKTKQDWSTIWQALTMES